MQKSRNTLENLALIFKIGLRNLYRTVSAGDLEWIMSISSQKTGLLVAPADTSSYASWKLKDISRCNLCFTRTVADTLSAIDEFWWRDLGCAHCWSPRYPGKITHLSFKFVLRLSLFQISHIYRRRGREAHVLYVGCFGKGSEKNS